MRAACGDDGRWNKQREEIGIYNMGYYMLTTPINRVPNLFHDWISKYRPSSCGWQLGWPIIPTKYRSWWQGLTPALRIANLSASSLLSYPSSTSNHISTYLLGRGESGGRCQQSSNESSLESHGGCWCELFVASGNWPWWGLPTRTQRIPTIPKRNVETLWIARSQGSTKINMTFWKHQHS